MPSGTFNISAACWRRTLLDVSVPGQRVTTFVQSWSVGMRQLIEQELQPAASSFELTMMPMAEIQSTLTAKRTQRKHHVRPSLLPNQNLP